MDTIREQLNKPVVVGVAGLILGIILGLIYAWVINPVEWTDAAVEQLRLDLKEDYMRMAIDSYAVNEDAALAQDRYSQVGEEAAEILATIQADPGMQTTESIQAFATAVQAEPVAAEPAEEAAGGIMRTLLPILCVILLLLAGALVALFIIRNRSAEPAPGEETAAPKDETQADWVEYAAVGDEPPVAQFISTYRYGNDTFDESYSIDSPSGEFLGECGVGISEQIGVGEPKKVTAFEVWLFDKNDIQTITKVLMSAHAFSDEETKQLLAAKGEGVLVAPGSEFALETQTLRLVVRVVDSGYGDGTMPEQSYFDRLVVELTAWAKV